MTYLTFLGNYVGPQNAFKWVERIRHYVSLEKRKLHGFAIRHESNDWQVLRIFCTFYFILNFFIRKKTKEKVTLMEAES